MDDPLFLTYKYCIRNLDIKIYDFQLRHHLINMNDIYKCNNCQCKHTHRRIKCVFRWDAHCNKCNEFNDLLMDYKSLMFHQELLMDNSIYRCENCTHEHEPACKVCLNCNLGNKCIVENKFFCSFTAFTVCPYCKCFTKRITNTQLLKHHLYKIDRQLFFLCTNHVHTHMNSTVPCYVQTYSCCENAINIKDYKSSFFVNALCESKKKRKINHNFIFYTPKIWTDQSTNQFISCLTSIINNDYKQNLKNYTNFTESTFHIVDISKYKSGGKSAARLNITGFLTKGFYQTAIISCLLTEDVVLIPSRLFDLIKDHYYTEYVVIKRDPSFSGKCAFIVIGIRNPDETCEVFILNARIIIPMVQDQDGDKNGLYLLKRKITPPYDRSSSFPFWLSVQEMKRALDTKLTTIAEPRYNFSEHDMVLFEREQKNLQKNYFFKRTFPRKIQFMNEAACSYLREEYKEFQNLLIEENRKPKRNIITIYDILQKTNKLQQILDSGAKKNDRSLIVLKENLESTVSLVEKIPELILQINRYIDSSKKLQSDGHSQFVLLYAIQDLNSFLGLLFLNKKLLCDFKTFTNIYSYIFTEAALELCIQDLELC